ncbi:unnamed protein product [Sphagnum tenellum]
MYSRKSQALLEAPPQIIFTFALVCNRVLLFPAEDKSYSVTSHFGNEIGIGLLPWLSMSVSVLSIMAHGISVFVSFDNNPTDCLTWATFYFSNVMFRLYAWTVLSVFLVDFIVIAAPVMLGINFLSPLTVAKVSYREQRPACSNRHGTFRALAPRVGLLLLVAGAAAAPLLVKSPTTEFQVTCNIDGESGVVAFHGFGYRRHENGTLHQCSADSIVDKSALA